MSDLGGGMMTGSHGCVGGLLGNLRLRGGVSHITYPARLAMDLGRTKTHAIGTTQHLENARPYWRGDCFSRVSNMSIRVNIDSPASMHYLRSSLNTAKTEQTLVQGLRVSRLSSQVPALVVDSEDG